ncbi:MAG: 16S rRNA (guanine(966)-N(2))-methyltransferase RsmD [Marivita sp.]|uniref:16S rRNA (guanine(966)-N(2))-methyltransferase RsmD n=1 Tax=Marivita sp. TaxID=2003365 RepID=UPI003EF8932B
MRIIAGRHRGRRLAALGKGDAAAHLRPTPDRVRESLFNVLAGYGLPDGARVLDLFAGSGALGFEALSRGADALVAIDDGRVSGRLIADNARTLAEDIRHLKCDATRLPRNTDAAFDLVFLDPPYGKGLGERALASARDGGWIAPDAVIVWEEAAPQDAPDGFTLDDHRRYGDTHLTLLRAT